MIDKMKIIEVKQSVFADNDADAEKLRKELVGLSHILILEDDYNGELVYASKIKTSLCSMSNHVIYFSSFSRLLLPSLRIGYMILNEEYTKLQWYKDINTH